MPNDLTQRSGNTQTGASERFNSGVSPLNQAIECRCGSTFFFTVHAEEFASGGYGSIEMRSLSNSPTLLRVCPCGEVFAPSKTGAGGARQVLNARDRFYDSIAKAKEFRERLSPDQIAKVTASKHELDMVMERLEQIERRLDGEDRLDVSIASEPLKLQGTSTVTVPSLPQEPVMVSIDEVLTSFTGEPLPGHVTDEDKAPKKGSKTLPRHGKKAA